MSTASVFTRPNKLPKMELIPPDDAEVEGVFRQPTSHLNGRIIYTAVEVDIPATKASKKVRLDEHGNELWKRHPTTGEKVYPLFRGETKYKKVRYVLNEQPVSRSVKKIYNFEPTPEELAELERRDAERDWQREFFRQAADSGLTPADVIAKIKADTFGDEDVELDVTEEVVAEMMAESDDSDMIERPDEEDGLIAVDDDGNELD